ncbi:MAG: hypothetical protein HKN47_06760 [Pirellulaceae bacterium]|nr:hypothetical protein [Pirellulaceae bacterium]
MTNPYQPGAHDVSNGPVRRPVRTLALTGILSSLLAGFTAVPGLYLLNQETQTVPTNSAVYEIEFGSMPMSNLSVMVTSLVIGIMLGCVAIASFAMARRNHRINNIDCPETYS